MAFRVLTYCYLAIVTACALTIVGSVVLELLTRLAMAVGM